MNTPLTPLDDSLENAIDILLTLLEQKWSTRTTWTCADAVAAITLNHAAKYLLNQVK